MFQELLPGITPEVEHASFNAFYDGDHQHLSPQLCSFALTKWLDCESKARMLISSDMTVRWMSSHAEELVESGVIKVCDGRLSPRTSILSNFVHDTSLSSHSCVIYLDTQQSPWIIWGRRLCGPPISLVGLIFHPPRQTACFTALVDTHILTPTEGRVVEMLLNGFETGRIAQSLNISNQTLKTHIKHAYCKLGVKSRGDLFAHAAGFARP